MQPSFTLFEKGSRFWALLTDTGKKPVPEYITRFEKSGDTLISETRFPILDLGKGNYAVDYNKILK